ncbi:enhancer-yellow 2 transcription factor [Saprolegnia diclina VS20]|uniref:Transcription and mRNA export factor ENY2 n=1 Tax=Saprolegnia diclina (strain VS20) TaxID=1156394 RepID=T0RV86_SAPDV|nr:enhancer-yellow 2 transcription factor [Saprolegnia diclina VS20]EQC36438.1 enhancer-yellow 2 transcription factor [Saprolegnia diclina VS20]|eukprot:XP_008609859.1 enhancer-yellow 2 transcription factor [Saprolegnia diclina VS20]
MAESYEYRKKLDEQVKETINQRLVESGEKERLKEALRQKLTECGWRDEMRTYCKELIKTKGINQITVEDLVDEITPKGRAAVPDSIKADMLERIRKFLDSAK